MSRSTRLRPVTLLPVLAAACVLVALLVAQAPANAHTGVKGAADVPTIGLQVNEPADLRQFIAGVHWSGSAPVDDQSAQLVYAGSGCSPASYAEVAAEIEGNIALVDSRASVTNPADQCPSYSYAQKVQSAEQAGAIALVHIADDGVEGDGANAGSSSIPAIEIGGFAPAYEVRDAVVAGTEVIATVARPDPLEAMTDLPCIDGMAGPFPCNGIDLLSFVPQEDFNGAGISDIWGWTDPDNDDEYVIIGKTNGVAFFRVTDPLDPVYVGELPNPGLLHATWHDIKVYANHAYIVSESSGHGMSVFDLTRLRGVEEPQVWDVDARYQLNDAAHNLAINTDTGFAYLVGGNAGLVAPDQCLSGLHMVDLSSPKDPQFAGCLAVAGGPGTAARSVGEEPVMEHSPVAYVHDTQCVVYAGPDVRYTGQEVCFNASEDEIVIADVTDKSSPTVLGRLPYEDATYSHQGWLTEDQAFFVANDELDEQAHEFNTRTIVVDVRDLENPVVHYMHLHELAAIDHNNYIVGDRAYQSNYSAGLRVLDVSNIEEGLTEVAFFDTFPVHTDPTFDGTWSNYPFFESGTIAVSGRAEGLFLVRVREGDALPSGLEEPDTTPTPTTGAADAIRWGALALGAVALALHPRRRRTA